jgi:hypothetical protein
MYNLLAQSNKDTLKREYYLRLGTIAFVAIALSAVAVIVYLLPAFSLVQYRYDDVLSRLGTAELSTHTINDSAAVASLGHTQQEINAIENVIIPAGASTLQSVIDEIISRKAAGISILDIKVTRTDAHLWQATVAGVAADRQALVVFQATLASDPLFSGVTIPVSTFEASSNISFSFTFTTKK